MAISLGIYPIFRQTRMKFAIFRQPKGFSSPVMSCSPTEIEVFFHTCRKRVLFGVLAHMVSLLPLLKIGCFTSTMVNGFWLSIGHCKTTEIDFSMIPSQTNEVSETSCDQQKKNSRGLVKRLPQVRSVERAWAARWLCACIGARWGTLGGGKKEGKKLEKIWKESR